MIIMITERPTLTLVLFEVVDLLLLLRKNFEAGKKDQKHTTSLKKSLLTDQSPLKQINLEALQLS